MARSSPRSASLRFQPDSASTSLKRSRSTSMGMFGKIVWFRSESATTGLFRWIAQSKPHMPMFFWMPELWNMMSSPDSAS
ncbi:hypothetical protein FQZ97_1031370 [compost metagenome]